MAKRKTLKKKQIKQYDHSDKKRVNNPPVGLVNESRDPSDGGKKIYAYDPHIDPSLQFDQNTNRVEIEKIIDNGLSSIAEMEGIIKSEKSKEFEDELKQIKEKVNEAKEALKELKKRQEPFLNWAGKAENTSFEVPTVSLHVHERIDPMRIIEQMKKKNGEPGVQGSLFEQDQKPLREAIEFYKHKEGWTNRMIAGDSLLIMNSLLEKEDMGAKVQMIYFDPPYGIKYGSNFMPFTNKRDVKDGKDEDLSAEPEMLKAFRDTWELGIHSYLSYIKDRLIHFKSLLKDRGSVFMQIGDENIHLVRALLDEVFGSENYCRTIPFVTTSGFKSKLLTRTENYLLWYAKDIEKIKYNQLYVPKKFGSQDFSVYNKIEDSSGNRRTLSKKEFLQINSIDKDLKIYRVDNLKSQGQNGFDFEFNGKVFNPGKSKVWKTHQDGMRVLQKKNRILETGTTLGYVRYFNDFPFQELKNIWTDTITGSFTEAKKYVVQTNTKVVERCILMTTDPGELIFDPTCGSGTSAVCAEKLGRRFITCDTSRIAITLAKERLISRTYDFYKLQDISNSISSGFLYEKSQRITLGSIANNEEPETIHLYDKPIIDKNKIRITSPFTIESVPAPTTLSIKESGDNNLDNEDQYYNNKETIRQDEWQQELLRSGVRVKGGAKIEFSRMETSTGTKYIQAIGETEGENSKRVFIIFGKEHAPMEQRQVELALDEADSMRPKPDLILFAAFQFDEEAAKDIDETKASYQLLKVQMNMDLQTKDLKKKQSSNESFWLIGAPDIEMRDGESRDMKIVEVKGFDYYDPRKGEVNSGTSKNIAMWMLDPDYDGRSIFPTQIFFPMSGLKDGWSKLAKTLKAELDEEKIEAFRGTVSLPFKPGAQVAVKIIDDRGIESLKILRS